MEIGRIFQHSAFWSSVALVSSVPTSCIGCWPTIRARLSWSTISCPRTSPTCPTTRAYASSVAPSPTIWCCATLPDDLDVAFHLACFHGNQSSIVDPLADHDNNTFTSLKLFDRLKDIGSLRKVVYAAAGCAVAKKTRDEPAATSEDADVELFHDSPYSISKLVGEMYGNYFFRRHKLPFVKARFQNVYGPREILGAGRWRGTPHTVWRNVTPTFVFKALHGEALPLINGGEDGRDFIFVVDLVEGLCRLATHGEPGEAYNLASGHETRIKELAAAINRHTGNKAPPAVEPPRDWDNSGRRYGDPTKSREKLGFTRVSRAISCAPESPWRSAAGIVRRAAAQLPAALVAGTTELIAAADSLIRVSWPLARL